jgi:P27 family predicted phage terminase small subunit
MSRPRKPTALKVVGGTDRADRRNGKEPEPPMVDDLTPPAHLDERAAAVWRQLAPMLRAALMLTQADVIAFEQLCCTVADVRRARELRQVKIKAGFDGFTTTSSKGGQMLDQLLVAEQMLAKRIESLGSRFGMDPASRTRLMVDPQGDLFDDKGAGKARFFA